MMVDMALHGPSPCMSLCSTPAVSSSEAGGNAGFSHKGVPSGFGGVEFLWDTEVSKRLVTAWQQSALP